MLAGGLLSALTAPGQTAGLSVFTDPLIEELDISRTAISASYLVGTLAGAIVQPLFGRALDRWGARTVTAMIAVAFSGVLFALSFVADVVGLTAGFVGVRMLGQGALSLAATTAVARAIKHRRGLALGIVTAMGSGGISFAPVGLEPAIALLGAHDTWRWQALVLLVVALPLAFVFKGRPGTGVRSADAAVADAAVADAASGSVAVDAASASVPHAEEPSATTAEALRTGMFWVLTASLATTGMLGTALAFHQIALLGAQGLDAAEAAANFLPQTATGILGTLVAGALVDRINPKVLIVGSMLSLGIALVSLPAVAPGWSAIGYGLVFGLANGALRGMEAATYVRYFGVAHIGSIRGIAISIGLGSTAVGPLALSLGVDLTGGFTGPVVASAVVPALVIVATFVVRQPGQRRPVRVADET